MEHRKDAAKEAWLESDGDSSCEEPLLLREKEDTAGSVGSDHPQQQESDSDEDDEDVQSSKKEVKGFQVEEVPVSGGTTWPKPRTLMEAAYEEPVVSHTSTPAVLSASSSFQADDNTSEPADRDTDRSTSPESSDRGKHVLNTRQNLPDISFQHSAKLASQLAAARHRQNSDVSMQQPEGSQIQQATVQRSYAASSVSSLRQRQLPPQPPPVVENLPLTGYELLATKLSSSGFDGGPPIKPIYRKFEALQNRLLLHMQDELVQLEEQLEQIDDADTQSRTVDRHIMPASRRAAAQIGGELEYHKADVLGRIGFKLEQYSLFSNL